MNNDDEFINQYLPLSLERIGFKLEIANQNVGSIIFTRVNENKFIHKVVSKNMWINDVLLLIPVNKNVVWITLTWNYELGIVIDFSYN